jgi:hypothetical protein
MVCCAPVLAISFILTYFLPAMKDMNKAE